MNTFALAIKYFFIDLVGGVLRWPFWWYTKGLVEVLSWCQNSIAGYAKQLALGVWIKNIFVPMYGARDWQSRIISVIMRTVQIVFRTIALIVFSFLVVLGFFIYFALPIVVGINIVFHFSALFL